MEISIEIKDKPMFTEFTMFAKPDLNKLKETKTINVEGSFITKTRVNTQMQIGNDRHGINFEVDGFKTDAVSSHSYFTNEHTISNYFKASKKQNEASYIDYVKSAVRIALKDYLKVELDKLTINLILPKFK